MESDENEAGSENLEFLPESTRAWWTSVLTGESETAHPIYGTDVATRLNGDTLILSGSVATMREREEIGAEAERLKGHGVASVRNELKVAPEVTDQAGLLTQTLIGIFENAELAGFAKGYLEDRLQAHPPVAKVIGADSGPARRAELRALLPRTFWEDARKAFDDGHALLLVTVDEPEAFRTRELLDEDTRSLRTIILPPEAAEAAPHEAASHAT